MIKYDSKEESTFSENIDFHIENRLVGRYTIYFVINNHFMIIEQ